MSLEQMTFSLAVIHDLALAERVQLARDARQDAEAHALTLQRAEVLRMVERRHGPMAAASLGIVRSAREYITSDVPAVDLADIRDKSRLLSVLAAQAIAAVKAWNDGA